MLNTQGNIKDGENCKRIAENKNNSVERGTWTFIWVLLLHYACVLLVGMLFMVRERKKQCLGSLSGTPPEPHLPCPSALQPVAQQGERPQLKKAGRAAICHSMRGEHNHGHISMINDLFWVSVNTSASISASRPISLCLMSYNYNPLFVIVFSCTSVSFV